MGRGRGILGVISYDDYTQKGVGVGDWQPKPSRAFIIEDFIPFASLQTLGYQHKPVQRISLTQGKEHTGLHLLPHSPKATYLKQVEQVLEDIRAGQYYQLNLLRYFTAEGADFGSLFPVFLERSGPMGAWIHVDQLEIASFSPERFVSIKLQDQKDDLLILTEPIKGTAPRGLTPLEDQRNASSLWESTKNQAELAMIIDLMRNDLSKIAIPGSVQVPTQTHPVELQSFANVHHLVGRICGSLKKGTALGGVLEALCPGGSITGAPKKAVIQAITRYEQRLRGYFMGHVFWMDHLGQWDSSILIRTLIREGGGPDNRWEFAAGSGLVIHSNPLEEYAEIDAKSRILTNFN